MAEGNQGANLQTLGERRQATIMFADISGLTSMSEKLDSEEVSGVMNDCFSVRRCRYHEDLVEYFVRLGEFARLELKQDLVQVARYLSQIDAVRHSTSPMT